MLQINQEVGELFISDDRVKKKRNIMFVYIYNEHAISEWMCHFLVDLKSQSKCVSSLTLNHSAEMYQ